MHWERFWSMNVFKCDSLSPPHMMLSPFSVRYCIPTTCKSPLPPLLLELPFILGESKPRVLRHMGWDPRSLLDKGRWERNLFWTQVGLPPKKPSSPPIADGRWVLIASQVSPPDEELGDQRCSPKGGFWRGFATIFSFLKAPPKP